MKGFYKKNYGTLKRFDKVFIIPLNEEEKKIKELMTLRKKKYNVIDKDKARKLIELKIIKIY